MSTHRHVKEALDKAIKAHQNAHRDHLKAADLEDHTEATVDPGPYFAGTEPLDMTSDV